MIRNLIRRLSQLLLAAGLILAGRSAYMQAKGVLARELIRAAWQETIRKRTYTAPWAWADTYPVARLSIPALGYQEHVLEGASPRNMAFGPTRLMNSAPLGEPGNIVLSGHRTSWFKPLRDIQVGQRVELEYVSDGTRALRFRSYVVKETHIIDPSETRYMASTDDDRLTLITCYPFGANPDSPQRWVVVAFPADAPAQDSASVPPPRAMQGAQNVPESA